MKRFLSIITLILISKFLVAQNMPTTKYQQIWTEIDNLLSKGLVKDAETKSNALFLQAKKEKNTAQIIKALCYVRVCAQSRDEKAQLNNIIAFQNEVKAADFPEKQILHSLIAELYHTYYNNNRWKIQGRTKIENKIQSTDIETWTADDFFKTITYHYQLSITEKEKLQSTSTETIQDIIEKGKNTETLRPTLYDILITRAISFFENDEIELTKPSYAFEIDDEKAFGNTDVFCKAIFKTNDTTSLKYNTLLHYQELLKHCKAKNNIDGLVDAELNRLNYVNAHSIIANKNTFYEQALKNIIATYKPNKQVAQAMYLLAANYKENKSTPQKNKRRTYNNYNTEENGDFAKAKEICDEVIKNYPNTEGSTNAKNLLNDITSKSLQVKTEKIILPNKPTLALVTFKNIPTCYARIVPLSIEDYKKCSLNNNEENEKIIKLKSKIDFVIDLPTTTDYKTHTTEIKIGELPVGNYALLLSGNGTFNKEVSPVTISTFSSSNLSYVTQSQYKGGSNVAYILHRNTGEPLADVTVKAWTNNYDYNTRKQTYTLNATLKSDANGKVILPNNNNNVSLELISKEEDLWIVDQMYLQENQPYTQQNIQTFLFTDRSIYRPGQTIYFKGIVINNFQSGYTRKSDIQNNRKTSVKLYDVNYQVIKTLEFTTNEFGSYAGNFTAPEGLLTGQFHLEAENGSAYFNVEEYKRPKFEVKYDTLKSTYRLNDEITIKGKALAFAGNNIDGANVKYTVKRVVRYPFYWCCRMWGMPQSEEMEITHGDAITNADGSFNIKFKAIPDNSIDKNTMPVFDYEINSDVTDVNGETRSGKQTISVAYNSLLIDMQLPEKADVNDAKKIHITTTNLAGTFVANAMNVKISSLKSPTKYLRKRYWEKPELNSIKEADFRKDFPDDEYNNEMDYQTWNTDKTVFDKTITSTQDATIDIGDVLKTQGWYVVEATTTDKYGEVVKEKKYIYTSAYNAINAETYEPLLVSELKTNYQPNDVAKNTITTCFDKIYLLSSIAKEISKKDSTELSVITNHKKEFQYPITEEDRGGFSVSYLYIKNNRVFTAVKNIAVPWTNKELKITLETFRDKILPGSEQEWKLKISGTEKEKVSAELLASMYDASLDEFKPHTWNAINIFTNNAIDINWETDECFAERDATDLYSPVYIDENTFEKVYPSLQTYGLMEGRRVRAMMMRSQSKSNMEMADASVGYATNAAATEAAAPAGNTEMKVKPQVKFTPPMAVIEEIKHAEASISLESTPKINTDNIQLRKNFTETAFFFPQLHTDAEGNIILKFKAPDALTRWKMMLMAHTQDLKAVYQENTITTQKELMVVPNTPRFMRESDEMIYSAKISNLSNKDVTGTAQLELIDAATNLPVDELFLNKNQTQPFSAKKGESVAMNWSIKIPSSYTTPILVKIVAKTTDASDGEQNAVPIILNSMLVTETMPLPVKGNTTKSFSFAKLLNSTQSTTLKPYNVTVEYTSNPAWYAVQALPYLNSYPYECAEQTFNKYYANVLATHIANSNKLLRDVFSQWEKLDSNALKSNLQKNEELKSVLLQETPWVMEAKSEEEQKHNIALLFNLQKMKAQLERTTRELEVLQTPNGGFTWFKGMPDDRFITQYILTGLGRLIHINTHEVMNDQRIQKLVDKGLHYLDDRIKEDYDYLVKSKTDLTKQTISYHQIQYLYMRSFFKADPVNERSLKAFNYYKTQAATYWNTQNKYMQGMSALALSRFGDTKTPALIIESLKQNAIHNEEMGMYWKELSGSYWWYEAPIEAQSLLIECFTELTLDGNAVDEMKTWLLKQKQTQNWKTTKATADACYALLLEGSNWLNANPTVTMQIGNEKVTNEISEAGTGYFKKSFDAKTIQPTMGNIKVDVKGMPKNASSWGAVYFQYFENLDKITSSETPLKLKKQLYKIVNGDRGETLVAISDNASLKVGDKVKVRIELRVDRDMEYVHMKDMRGACFEPTNVLSQYKYQGGLGYYEATKDVATNFFFNWLSKGTYVFEYPMFVTNKGNFSNGICSIQCMYAPEFSSHSDGIRVKVD
jgi:uncharacterized protein YfaS (alpha-2-macroglobulin family)